MDTWFEHELDTLLGESIPAARQREASTFGQYADRYDGNIVLFGAGRLGRKLLAAIDPLRQRVGDF